jgi:alpha-glucosidase
MLRPLTFLDQNDPETYLRMAEFALGDHLLVCPITQAGADGRWMYLPKGEWYYYWTDELKAGGAEVWASADLTRIPLFIKAGAVVPMQPIMQYVGEQVVEQLTLHVYYKNGTAESVLYDDGGEGYAYHEGQQTTRRFTVVGNAISLTLRQASQGEYQTPYSTYRVVLHGLPAAIAAATADAQAVAPEEYPATETTVAAPAVVVGVGFGEVKIELAPPTAEVVAPA